MLAAAALSRSVDDVIVLERDELPDGPHPRKRIPQARHAHILLPSGRDAIQELLPEADVRQRLLASGAHEQSITGVLGFGAQGWYRRWPTVADDLLLAACCSRDLLDSILRDAVLGTTRVADCASAEGAVAGCSSKYAERVPVYASSPTAPRRTCVPTSSSTRADGDQRVDLYLALRFGY